MKKADIKCAGCGKVIPVTTGEGHTGIAKCDCGATTYVTGEPGAVLEQLNEVLGKIPAILKEFKQSRRKGFDTGLDDALHAVSMDLATEILKEDHELREALKGRVRESLESGLGFTHDDEPEAPTR
jgi:hypothetical protein